MKRSGQSAAAGEFRALHHDGGIVVLPNAFDVATARLIARREPVAIGTTSAAIAAGLGYPDGEVIGRGEMLAAVERIAGSVEVGVTADIEAGYGDAPEDAAMTASGVVEAGAIGLNLQDTGNPSGQHAGALLPIELAAEKVAAARAAADDGGVAIVVNARTDAFLGLAEGDPLEESISRGRAYLDAGADCVFAPGIADPGEIKRLIDELQAPLNVYAVPGVPDVPTLAALGVARVSVGCGPYQSCLALVDHATREFLEGGSYDGFLLDAMPYPAMLELVS